MRQENVTLKGFVVKAMDLGQSKDAVQGWHLTSR
jgi:hypothetical protein